MELKQDGHLQIWNVAIVEYERKGRRKFGEMLEPNKQLISRPKGQEKRFVMDIKKTRVNNQNET